MKRAAESQARILLISDSIVEARPLLTQFYQAGVECNLALGERDGVAQVRTQGPHLVVVNLGSAQGASRISHAIRAISSALLVSVTRLGEKSNQPIAESCFDEIIGPPSPPSSWVDRILTKLPRGTASDA